MNGCAQARLLERPGALSCITMLRTAVYQLIYMFEKYDTARSSTEHV